jgi:hypothetical protein
MDVVERMDEGGEGGEKRRGEERREALRRRKG